MRHPTDAYLSSPCSAIALCQWMLADPTTRPSPDVAVFDPFAGAGSLVRWFAGGRAATYVHELDTRWTNELLSGGHAYVRCPVDSFETAWVERMVITNPPYLRVAEAVALGVEHARRRATWSWFLLREDWFSHEGRPVPDWYLKLRWRPSMGMATDKRTGHRRPGTDRFTGYVWAGWGPARAEPRIAFLERPAVDPALVREHRRLLEIADSFREAA